MLAEWKAQHPDEGEPVFLSAHAGRIRRQSAANVARRLKTAIKHADRRLHELGSKRSASGSLHTRCAGPSQASEPHPVMIRSTSPSSSGTPTRVSR